MLIYIFIALSGVFLVWGIIYVSKHYYDLEGEEKKAVPIDSLREMKEIQISEQFAGQEQDSENNLSKHFIDENLGKVNTSSKETDLINKKSVDNLNKEYKAKIEESKRLEEYKSKMELLSEQLAKKDKEIESHINILKNENLRLKEALEVEMSSKNTAMLDDEQNERLVEAEKHLSNTEKAIDKLSSENLQLSRQLTEMEETSAKFKNEIDILKQKLSENEKENELREKLSQQKKEYLDLIEELKHEQNALLKSKEDLEVDIKKLKSFNDNLIEKEKILQYELTKSRAQALGLEKICKDFKIQIDEMNNNKSSSKK